MIKPIMTVSSLYPMICDTVYTCRHIHISWGVKAKIADSFVDSSLMGMTLFHSLPQERSDCASNEEVSSSLVSIADLRFSYDMKGLRIER